MFEVLGKSGLCWPAFLANRPLCGREQILAWMLEAGKQGRLRKELSWWIFSEILSLGNTQDQSYRLSSVFSCNRFLINAPDSAEFEVTEKQRKVGCLR